MFSASGTGTHRQTNAPTRASTTGRAAAGGRRPADVTGYRKLLDLLADHGDTEAVPIPVSIETSRGLLVAVLRTGTRQVFATRLPASRCRD